MDRGTIRNKGSTMNWIRRFLKKRSLEKTKHEAYEVAVNIVKIYDNSTLLPDNFKISRRGLNGLSSDNDRRYRVMLNDIVVLQFKAIDYYSGGIEIEIEEYHSGKWIKIIEQLRHKHKKKQDLQHWEKFQPLSEEHDYESQ